MAGQDIAPIPACANPANRRRADADFRFFCETYFPKVFYLPWSEDHLRVIAKIERVVIHRDTLAVAMPRGHGKTSLCLAAVEWGILTGRHPFVYLIAGSEETAIRLLANVKTHLMTSDELLADYPESIYPIRSLGGESRRCNGQRYYGVSTRIVWGKDEVALPTIPSSPASGAMIRVSGLTGNIRGAVHARSGGGQVRPTLVVCDDPQTDATARSPLQTKERLDLLRGAVLGLAGPGEQAGVIVPCTVIEPGDMADQLLDHEKNPMFRGERTKLLNAFPANEGQWARYIQQRADEVRKGGDGRQATEFYREHRASMDRGAEAAWVARFAAEAGEISAIQHAMNLMADRGREAFFAEFQNEPVLRRAANLLRPGHVMERVTGRPRGEVPLTCTRVTAFVDVHDKLLYWLVAAWGEDFTGHVVDYGTSPEQPVPYFSMESARQTLSGDFPGAGLDGAIQAGLERLAASILAHEFLRGPGAMRVERLLIDAGWKPGIIEAVKRKVGGATTMAYRGLGIKAGRKPMSSWAKKPGERFDVGGHWYVPNVHRTREYPHVGADVNYWKTFVYRGLATAPGDPGALTLFGKDPHEHELLAQHLVLSETWNETTGHGRGVHEWELLPAKPDNHWFDCLVGCAVAASMLGCVRAGEAAAKPRGYAPRCWTAQDLRSQRR
jgi:hypothetical protein